MEVCGFVLNIVFMFVLSAYRKDLNMSRGQITEKIFKKMANDKKNFLWQLSFFLLQRIHIVLLCAIFMIGMNSINVYYIGLLYFILKFISSTP